MIPRPFFIKMLPACVASTQNGSGTFVLFATRLLQIVLKVEADGVSTKKMWCTLSQSPAEPNCSASGKK
jgi:hypothetical protein